MGLFGLDRPRERPSLALRTALVVLALGASASAGCNRSGGGSFLPQGGSTQAPSSGPAEVLEIESGARHSCAVKSDGSVWCWGRNERGQLGDGSTQDRIRAVRVDGVEGATRVALGSTHSCALTREGAVWCWGAGAKGQLGDGSASAINTKARQVSGLEGVTQISAGAEHSCARHRDGRVSCWGSNETRQLGHEREQISRSPVQVEGFMDAIEVATGGGHTCVLRKTGAVLCFGANRLGQLGDGGTRGHARPSKVEGLEGVIDIAAYADASCAVRTSGSVMCWGDAPSGASPRAAVVAGVSAASEVGLGEHHACALGKGSLACWGENVDGRLGDGTFTSRPQPRSVRDLARVSDFSVGGRFSCALARGEVSCWGDEYAVTSAPAAKEGGLMPVRGVEGARALAAGDGFACAIDEQNAVWCWGANDKGQLGAGDRKDRDTPVRVRDLPEATAITAGRAHACAARKDGRVYCWGDDSAGQITPNRSGSRPFPARVAGPSSAVALAAGDQHTCAVERTGSVVCWGSDEFGQLGDGAGRRNGRVVGMSDAVEVAAGRGHTCVRRRGGQVSCWGANNQGQIGNGAGAAQLSTLVEVPATATKVIGTTGISVGDDHSCALLSDGRAQCWGRNDKSQLGSGTSSTWTTRVPVKNLAGATSLGAGNHHTCASAGGRLRCWGDNGAGQGAGSTKVAPTPAMGPPLDATQISAGRDHTCARTRTGAVVCWGDDTRGQLGLGDRGFARVPTAVAGL